MDMAMKEFLFDKKVFNRGYGFIYSLLQNVFASGFILIVTIVVLSSTINWSITIPDMFFPFIAVYLMSSFVGFPLAAILKVGYRRLVAESDLSYDGKILRYKKLTDKLWTAVGYVEEYHLYTVLHIKSVTTTRRYFIITGEIEKTIINNNRILDSVKVDRVKIPTAYVGMDFLLQYCR